ncbi:UNVERIFIED_CONTAM: hypothetical protein NY603_31995, partial [Bacteroidetes bacterium 56_B9]
EQIKQQNCENRILNMDTANGISARSNNTENSFDEAFGKASSGHREVTSASQRRSQPLHTLTYTRKMLKIYCM